MKRKGICDSAIVESEVYCAEDFAEALDLYLIDEVSGEVSDEEWDILTVSKTDEELLADDLGITIEELNCKYDEIVRRLAEENEVIREWLRADDWMKAREKV